MGECRAVCSRVSGLESRVSGLGSSVFIQHPATPLRWARALDYLPKPVGNSDDPTRSGAPLARIFMIVRPSIKNSTYPSAFPALQATREAFFEGWHCRVEGGPTARTALMVNVCIPICDL